MDAQLPRSLAQQLRELGHEAMHTLDLPMGNRTRDAEIHDISVREQCVVITKDADFVTAFTLHRLPYKLLLVSTGNNKRASGIAL